MNRIRQLRFDEVSGAAFLFEVVKAVAKGRDTVLGYKIHESGQRRPAQFGGTAQRYLTFAIQFDGEQPSSLFGSIAFLEIRCSKEIRRQLYVDGVHRSNVRHRWPFVMRFSARMSANLLILG